MDTGRAHQLVQRIHDVGPGMPHEAAAAQAELQTIIAAETSSRLARLSADVEQAQKILGTRIGELTNAIAAAAKSSSDLAGALIFWTWWYVFVTIAIVGGDAGWVILAALRK